VFRVGGGVSAPRALNTPDPEYSEEARKAKYQGTVVLWLIVDQNGHPQQVKVARSLGMGLDEKAIEAVRKWTFEPAQKDGKPVAVQINVEVNFRRASGHALRVGGCRAPIRIVTGPAEVTKSCDSRRPFSAIMPVQPALSTGLPIGRTSRSLPEGRLTG
jgi:TonB family protein